MTGRPLADFLVEARAALAARGQDADRIVAEIRDHLEASTAVRQQAGVPREQAEREAVACFGGVASLVRGLDAADTSDGASSGLLKIWQAGLAALTGAAAVAIILHAVESGLGWRTSVALPLGTAAVILAHGIYTILRPHSILNGASGLALVLLGIFVMVCHGLFAHSIGLGYEAPAVIVGVLVIVQGGLGVIAVYENPLTI